MPHASGHQNRLALGQAVRFARRGLQFSCSHWSTECAPSQSRCVGNTDYRKKSPVGMTCQFIFGDLRGGDRVVPSVARRSRNSSPPARRMLRWLPGHGNAARLVEPWRRCAQTARAARTGGEERHDAPAGLIPDDRDSAAPEETRTALRSQATCRTGNRRWRATMRQDGRGVQHVRERPAVLNAKESRSRPAWGR